MAVAFSPITASVSVRLADVLCGSKGREISSVNFSLTSTCENPDTASCIKKEKEKGREKFPLFSVLV